MHEHDDLPDGITAFEVRGNGLADTWAKKGSEMTQEKDIAKKVSTRQFSSPHRHTDSYYFCYIVRKQSNFNEDIFLLPTLLT